MLSPRFGIPPFDAATYQAFDVGPMPSGAEIRVWGIVEDMHTLAGIAQRLDRVANDLIWEAVERELARIAPEDLTLVVAYAGEEAESLGHQAVHPSHLLLGILRCPTTTGARTLIHRGAALPVLRAAIAEELAPVARQPADSDGLTRSARQIVDGALRTASGEQRTPDTLDLLEGLLTPRNVQELWPILGRARINLRKDRPARADEERPAGGEMVMQGTPAQVSQLTQLAHKWHESLDTTLWEAVQRVWFSAHNAVA